MDSIRFKQAKNLILKSTKKSKNNKLVLKEAESGTIDIKLFELTFKKLIKAEEFIYKSLPTHKLNKKEAIEFTKYLIDIRDEINLQLANFKVIEEEAEEINIDELTSNILFITTKNNFKKVLKKLGVNAQRIIVADVPLILEDMKKINPKIPEGALKGIGKKIEHINNDINRKTKQLKPHNIITLVENDINGELLAKRSKELYNAQIYFIEDLKELDESELKEIINS